MKIQNQTVININHEIDLVLTEDHLQLVYKGMFGQTLPISLTHENMNSIIDAFRMLEYTQAGWQKKKEEKKEGLSGSTVSWQKYGSYDVEGPKL